MTKTLVCTKCYIEKQIEEFVKSKLVKCGYTSTCLVCHRKRVKDRESKKNYAPIKEKFCKTCEITKKAEDFYIAKLNTTGLSTECKECTKHRRKINAEKRGSRDAELRKIRYSKNIERFRAQKRNYTLAHYEKHVVNKARTRARKKGVDFNLTESDIVIPKNCPILKVPLVVGNKGSYKYSPSLDRIDNSKGYIKGNIQIISSLANTMKNEASFEELKLFAKYILKNY